MRKTTLPSIQIVLGAVLLASNANAADVTFPVVHVVVSNKHSAVVAADIDGDGALDIVGGHTTTDSSPNPSGIAWWANTAGDGSVWTATDIDTGSFATPFVADVDGDGDMDVLGADPSGNGTISWWENTAGNGSAWTTHLVAGSFGGATSVFAGDIDGDGDTDILGSAGTADDIAWWENTAGDGSAWTKHNVETSFDGASAVYGSDLDGDGDLDILASARNDDEIAWWQNTAGDGSAWTKKTVDSLVAKHRWGRQRMDQENRSGSKHVA